MLNEDETGAPRDPAWPGLARELARMNLSLNFYTQWYWKIDLHNLLHFLSLRADPHAQYEIRAYADAMLDTLKRWVPMAYAAFLEYRMNAATISATGLAVIRRMLAGETVDQASSGLSAARMARADGGAWPGSRMMALRPRRKSAREIERAHLARCSARRSSRLLWRSRACPRGPYRDS